MGPGWQANNYGPTAGAGPSGPSGTYDENNPLPGQFIDANGGRFYVLGSDPKTGNPIWSSFVSDKGNTVVISGRLVDAGTGQVLADFSNPSGGSGDGGVSATSYYTQQQQNARDAAQLAEQQRQFNEQFGADKARGDQQQQLAQGQALGFYNGQNTLARDQLNQNQSQFNTKTAIDYYTQLANLAANPRNFVELLDRTRGVTPPANSAQYSNVAQFQRGNPNIPLPSFMSAQPPSQPAAQQAQGGTNPYAGTNANYGGSPTTADTAMINGVKTWAGGPYSGIAVDKAPANAGDLTPYLKDPNTPDPTGRVTQHFSGGGVLPEPIVGRGLISGKTYTFNEKGPEGVVPADMLPKFLQSRHGQAGAYANGGMLGFDPGTGGDPYATDPYATQTTPDPTAPPSYTPNQPYSTVPWSTPAQTPNDPSNPYSGAYNPYDLQTTQTYGPQVPTGHGPVVTPGTDYSAIGASLAAAANASNPNVNKLPIPPLLPQTPQSGASTAPAVAPTAVDPYAALKAQLGTSGTAPIVEPLEPPIPPPMQMIRQPTQLPQGGGTPGTQSNLTASAPTPREVSAPGTFGNISGNRPQFLPGEDMGGTIGQLIASGMLPAFMTRLLGQARGDQSVGTNQPQPYELPNGLPLASSLALANMTPSERAALESIVSSYGIPWEDYVAQITASSPAGPSTQLPAFGQPFYSYRQ